MTRRNVDLVISARDEAEKVLRQITAALNEFSNASQGVGGSAEKAESSLGQLGAAIGTLEGRLGGLQIADKLDGELRKAERSLTRLEEEFAKSGVEAQQLEQRLAQTGNRADTFARKLDGATAALSRQKTAVATAKTDQRELSAAYASAERSQERLSARQAQLPQQIERQSAALDKATARYRDLADQIRGTAEPSRTLRNQFEASERSVASNTEKLTRLRAEYAEIGGRIRAAGSAMVLFGGAAERAAQDVTRQQRALGQIKENLTALRAQSRAAAAEQGRLQGRVTQATQALERQQSAIDRAKNNYVDLAVSAGRADEALAELSSRSLGRLSEELKQQRLAALRAKREYLELSQTATQLATAIGRVGVPTREMAESFARTKVAARAAKSEYQAQRQALELMGRAYRDTGQDLESINSTQARFQTILDRTGVELKRVADTAKNADIQIERLYSSTNRTAGGMQRLASASNRTANANQRAARSASTLAEAYRQFYGDSRRSLSLLQRIRGEVLSLVAAYGGLFAVIETLRGTVDAYQQLEAAQARINVAVGGDFDAAQQELDFVRRTADRLGVQFGVLATEYSKFSIATQNTNLEGEATRRIFTAVAEAARVNRSSTREMSGVFVALTQIVSKGAVQMEELRQQLGDRLPGALRIMADGLGVTTAELTKMLENGEVTADALIPFAEELEKRFGPGLGEALESTSTALGRLANEAFEALLRFGEAGFLESFTELAQTITSVLQSAQFQDFSARVSAALAEVVRSVGFAIENFDFLLAAFTAFAALKLTPLVLAMAKSFRAFARDAVAAAAGVSTIGTSATTATGRIAALGAAFGRLRIALTALLGTTGIGLLVAAVGAGVALWATSATDATEAMTEHERIVDAVKNAYDAVGGSVENWGKALEGVTVTEARRSLQDIREALLDATSAFDQVNNQAGSTFATRFFGINLVSVSEEYQQAIQEVIRQLRNGEIEYGNFVEAIDAVNEEFRDGSDVNERYATALVSAAKEVERLFEAYGDAEAVVRALTGSQEEQAEALRELNGETRESAALIETAEEKAERFDAALKEIAKTIPSVKRELDFLEQSEALDKMLLKALQAAQSWQDVASAIRLAGQAQLALDTNLAGQVARFAQGDNGIEAAAGLLRNLEGFRATPYYDVNAFRAGFGSDTITLADGTIKKVTQGMRVSVEDANRDLLRRLTTEFAPIAQRAAGTERFANFSPQQQAALISIAYNYGEIPDRIVDAVRTGSDAQIARAIQSLGGDNGGINRRRRNQEAALFLAGTDVEAQARAQQSEAERAQREGQREEEQRQREREATQQRLADGEFEIAQQELINQGKERQAAIEEAIREARAADPNITEEEIAKIREQTAAVFDLEQAKKNSTTASEAAKEAEDEVNNLLAQRRALEEQLQLARSSGDFEQFDNLRLRIGEINAELTAAIDNAIRMWEAVGGSGAEAAIANLRTARIEVSNFGLDADRTYLRWERVGDLFVNGLSNAFAQFAQAVAQGEDIVESARLAFLKFASDFLLQIAQMIIQQAIFNALRAAFGGTPFGALIGVGAAHTGGIIGGTRAGSGNQTRRVSPAVFSIARRFHEGGMIGLRPGEVPIIAKQGEEVLTRDDPRHMLNGGAKGDVSLSQQDIEVRNYMDAAAFFEAGARTDAGRKIIYNIVRSFPT